MVLRGGAGQHRNLEIQKVDQNDKTVKVQIFWGGVRAGGEPGYYPVHGQIQTTQSKQHQRKWLTTRMWGAYLPEYWSNLHSGEGSPDLPSFRLSPTALIFHSPYLERNQPSWYPLKICSTTNRCCNWQEQI